MEVKSPRLGSFSPDMGIASPDVGGDSLGMGNGFPFVGRVFPEAGSIILGHEREFPDMGECWSIPDAPPPGVGTDSPRLEK